MPTEASEILPRAQSLPGSEPARERLAGAVLGAARDNFVLLLVLLPMLGAAAAFDRLTGIPVLERMSWTSLGPMGIWAVRLAAGILLLPVGAFAVQRLARLVGARRAPGADLPTLADAWRAFPFRPTGRQFLRAVLALMMIALFFQLFIGFKGAIPLVQPFTWDTAFMRLDRVLHFGQDPWRLLHPLLGYPLVTQAVDFFYYLWFPVKLGGILWFAWMADGPERRQFFLAFLLTWILLGNVAALVFSSAGPCYFELATGTAGPYAGLMEYLHGVDGLLAVEVQATLLEGYSTTELHTVEGIAAMPSLHVAIPFLFALATRARSRAVSWGFVAFGIVTLIGSVHLGWHYAVDGYAAVAAVVVIWWGVGRVVEGRSREEADA